MAANEGPAVPVSGSCRKKGANTSPMKAIWSSWACWSPALTPAWEAVPSVLTEFSQASAWIADESALTGSAQASAWGANRLSFI